MEDHITNGYEDYKTPIEEYTDHLRVLEWNGPNKRGDNTENFVVPCPVCGSLHLKLAFPPEKRHGWLDFGDAIFFTLKCNDCDHYPIGLGLEQITLPDHDSSYIKLVTD